MRRFATGRGAVSRLAVGLTGMAMAVGASDRPNLDLIASLRPDLIASTTVRHDRLYDKLAALAPTVLVVATGPTWKENVTLLGRALGAEIRAAQELTRYEARAKQLGDEINTRADNPTISVVRFGDGNTHLMTGASFVGVILADTFRIDPVT
ncbi:ABC transporter substrate-binding protein [Plantactinospora sp. B24E8]|uniref:ABC transporter substrate-binding protein n=1 Tax=Plantactinospora sp. B24E8 TaxID=3153567 RepID=UPI00325D5CFA